VEGGGEGAGGFCANPTGTKSPIASASSTKMRMCVFIDLFLGRKRLSCKFSAQVSSSQGFRSGQAESLPKALVRYSDLPGISGVSDVSVIQHNLKRPLLEAMK
jgi:hypothetical protein